MHIGRTLKTFHTLLRVTPALDVSMEEKEHGEITGNIAIERKTIIWTYKKIRKSTFSNMQSNSSMMPTCTWYGQQGAAIYFITL